jgi:hypothetical protein
MPLLAIYVKFSWKNPESEMSRFYTYLKLRQSPVAYTVYGFKAMSQILTFCDIFFNRQMLRKKRPITFVKMINFWSEPDGQIK